MKHARHILRTLVLAVALIAVGQNAWADVVTGQLLGNATGGNILRGSLSEVTVTAGKVAVDGEQKTAYVLSVDESGAIGFRQYSGGTIPARKAYYLQ